MAILLLYVYLIYKTDFACKNISVSFKILLATSLSLSGNVFKKILKIPFNLHFSGAFFGVFQFWVANLRGSLRTYFFCFPKNCFIPNENMNSDDGSFYSERIWKLLILWPHLNSTSWSLLKPGVKNPKSH